MGLVRPSTCSFGMGVMVQADVPRTVGRSCSSERDGESGDGQEGGKVRQRRVKHRRKSNLKSDMRAEDGVNADMNERREAGGERMVIVLLKSRLDEPRSPKLSHRTAQQSKTATCQSA